MSDDNIRNMWNYFVTSNEYRKYFLNDEDKWKENLNKVQQYIDRYKKLPCALSKNLDVKTLGKWLSHQQSNYKNRDKCMKNENIYSEYNKFITSQKYKKYFISNEEIWNIHLTELKTYIEENNELPNCSGKNKKLANWTRRQIYEYENKCNIMSNLDFRNKFKKFVTSEEYKEYFPKVIIRINKCE